MFDAVLFSLPLPTISSSYSVIPPKSLVLENTSPFRLKIVVPLDSFYASLLLLNMKSKYIKYTSKQVSTHHLFSSPSAWSKFPPFRWLNLLSSCPSLSDSSLFFPESAWLFSWSAGRPLPQNSLLFHTNKIWIEHYAAIRSNRLDLNIAAWVNLKNIVFSERSKKRNEILLLQYLLHTLKIHAVKQ